MLLDHLRHLRTQDTHAGLSRIAQVTNLIKVVALCADTTTIRIILANASLMWAIASLLDPLAFQRDAYAVLRQVADQSVWAAAFLLHFAGVYWRLFDPVARPIWALVINSYGFAVWFVSTAAVNLAVGGFAPGSALEWTMCMASAWALYRTGLNREIVTP